MGALLFAAQDYLQGDSFDSCGAKSLTDHSERSNGLSNGSWKELEDVHCVQHRGSRLRSTEQCSGGNVMLFWKERVVHSVGFMTRDSHKSPLPWRVWSTVNVCSQIGYAWLQGLILHMLLCSYCSAVQSLFGLTRSATRFHVFKSNGETCVFLRGERWLWLLHCGCDTWFSAC